MPDGDANTGDRTPVLYVTDLAFDSFDPADLFDLAFLLRAPEYDLRAVCLPPGGDGDRIIDALAVRAGVDTAHVDGADGLLAALSEAPGPLSLIVVGGYGMVAEVLGRDRDLFRARVARLFLVGGYVNDYAGGVGGERLAFNPRLREQNPERFAGAHEARTRADSAAFGRLLTSGEGVIWLPRDISLWRYYAPGILSDAGPVAEFLLRELFFTNLRNLPTGADRYDAADSPVLLSAPPAFLLARRPDPMGWMRLFRAVTARVETGPEGVVMSFTTRTDRPNLYVVVGIDGRALGKLITARLRDRPLVAEKE